MSVPAVVISTPRSRWTDGRVFGLGDPVGAAQILNRSLTTWRNVRLLASKTNEPLAGPALVWGEDLWVSPGMVRAFCDLAQKRGGGITRLARDIDGPGATADPLGRLPRSQDGGLIQFDLWYVPQGHSLSLAADGELPPPLLDAKDMDVPCKSHKLEVAADRVSTGGESHQMELSFSNVAAAPVSHWVELMRANLLALGTQALGRGPVRGALSIAWAAFKAMSINPFRVMAKVTTRGRRCWIHPSAVVEGCVLGDNVKVDACAVLRGCVIGDNAKVGPLALGEFSVIGKGAELQKQATATVSVIYPGARIGGLVQLSVVGNDVRHKAGSFTTDMNPTGGPVKVLTPDGLADVDIGYLGACFGHGAFVGSGIWIAPGRLIEGGRLILRDAANLVMK